MEYQLTRSKRKTLVLYVRPDGVEVRAPLRCPQRTIDTFLLHKQGWITKQQAALAQQAQQRLCITQGAAFPFKGQDYQLRLQDGSRNRVCLADDELHVHYSARSSAEAALSRWLKQQAEEHLTAEVATVAEQLGVADRVSDITLRKTKSKWGHCTHTGRLQFNWLIMLAPCEVRHYLVCHELSHLLQMNHSPRFWKQVETVCPDYLALRQHLKSNGHRYWF